MNKLFTIPELRQRYLAHFRTILTESFNSEYINGLIDNYDSSFIEGFVTTNISATKTFFKKFNFQVGLSNNLISYTDQNTPKIPGFLGFIKLNYRI